MGASIILASLFVLEITPYAVLGEKLHFMQSAFLANFCSFPSFHSVGSKGLPLSPLISSSDLCSGLSGSGRVQCLQVTGPGLKAKEPACWRDSGGGGRRELLEPAI